MRRCTTRSPGLPNRVLLDDRLQSAARRSRRTDRPYGLLFVDLDGFKAVNDTLGHGAGDAVLVTVAGRLLDAVRGVDTVARVSGDEFVAILDDVDTDVLAIVTSRILSSVRVPITVAAGVATVTASIGAALVRPGDDPDTALHAADAAMYRAKHEGKARVSLVI
jgi:diguanylate cyclase (GGDEF)-like protein